MAGRTCQAKLIASLVVFLHKRQQSKAVCFYRFFFFILTLPPARLTNFQMPLRRRCMQHRRHRAHATGQTGGGLPKTGPGLTDCPTVASRLAAATVWMGGGGRNGGALHATLAHRRRLQLREAALNHTSSANISFVCKFFDNQLAATCSNLLQLA